MPAINPPGQLQPATWGATRLGVTLPRLYELVRTGAVPAVRVGRQIRVDPAPLEEWISSGGTSASDG
jgi:excisionase family DNA binding protein